MHTLKLDSTISTSALEEALLALHAEDIEMNALERTRIDECISRMRSCLAAVCAGCVVRSGRAHWGLRFAAVDGVTGVP